jgi:nucleoside-diphosphate kinase
MADTDERAVRNLIHASGSVAEADGEIALWFNDDEIIDYKIISEGILYDVNMDGILE